MVQAVTEFVGIGLVALGLPFFVIGTVGVLRMPDVYSRLHSLTKADNVGLGFVVLGLGLQSGSWHDMIKLLFIWLLVLISGAVSSHLIAQSAARRGVPIWRNE